MFNMLINGYGVILEGRNLPFLLKKKADTQEQTQPDSDSKSTEYGDSTISAGSSWKLTEIDWQHWHTNLNT